MIAVEASLAGHVGDVENGCELLNSILRKAAIVPPVRWGDKNGLPKLCTVS